MEPTERMILSPMAVNYVEYADKLLSYPKTSFWIATKNLRYSNLKQSNSILSYDVLFFFRRQS